MPLFKIIYFLFLKRKKKCVYQWIHPNALLLVIHYIIYTFFSLSLHSPPVSVVFLYFPLIFFIVLRSQMVLFFVLQIWCLFSMLMELLHVVLKNSLITFGMYKAQKEVRLCFFSLSCCSSSSFSLS
jgi:hypothetical protein